MDEQYIEKGRPRVDLSYIPGEMETSGIGLTGWVFPSLYISLKLTHQETLALVKALRQIPEIEQATVPEALPDLSDLVRHTGPMADQTMQQP
ncbi:MAG: hypothetical protein ACRDHZ_08065 [Ktedonobacteraceae bacterium]